MAIRNAATGIDTDLKLSSYDSENRKLVNELNDGLFFMSERDVEYVNKKTMQHNIHLKKHKLIWIGLYGT